MLQRRTRVSVSLRSTTVDHPSRGVGSMSIGESIMSDRKTALLRYRRHHAANVGCLRIL